MYAWECRLQNLSVVSVIGSALTSSFFREESQANYYSWSFFTDKNTCYTLWESSPLVSIFLFSWETLISLCLSELGQSWSEVREKYSAWVEIRNLFIICKQKRAKCVILLDIKCCPTQHLAQMLPEWVIYATYYKHKSVRFLEEENTERNLSLFIFTEFIFHFYFESLVCIKLAELGPNYKRAGLLLKFVLH